MLPLNSIQISEGKLPIKDVVSPKWVSLNDLGTFSETCEHGLEKNEILVKKKQFKNHVM
jgi:hypothetical protein